MRRIFVHIVELVSVASITTGVALEASRGAAAIVFGVMLYLFAFSVENDK